MANPTLDLQRCMADLLLNEDGDATFANDPIAFGAARGLTKADQAALDRQKSRLLTYRDLARSALEDQLPDCFPILHALLEEAGAWEDCVNAFIASRSIQSSYFRDVTPTFVSWLADSGWGQERWPFLLQLAHFEYIEVEILRWPDGAPLSDLKPNPAADLRVVFDAAARNLAYTYHVQDATKDDPEPEAGETFLLGYRDAEGDFFFTELSAHASAFLARCLEGASIAEAASALALSLEEVSELLTGLRDKGALRGFR
jgi:hypothetical protein